MGRSSVLTTVITPCAVYPGGQGAIHARMSGKPAPFMSGEPFNRCTHVAIDPAIGDFYVSDGYCNARVHKYAPDASSCFPGVTPGLISSTYTPPIGGWDLLAGSVRVTPGKTGACHRAHTCARGHCSSPSET